MSDISRSSLPSYSAPPDRAGGPLDEVEPVDASLVGLQAAAYCHAGSGTAICSVCYEKLVRNVSWNQTEQIIVTNYLSYELMEYDELEKKRFEGQSLFIGLVLGAFGNIVMEDLKYMVGLGGTGVRNLLFHGIVWVTFFIGVGILLNFNISKYWKTLWQPKKMKGSRIRRSGFIFRLRNYLRY